MPSKLIKDLRTVPDIIGELGLNIAKAQKALNHDYIENLDRIVGIAKDLIGKKAGTQAQPAPAQPAPGQPAPAQPAASAPPSVPTAQDILADVIKQLAPVRYVYSETTLAVKLDLAQSIEGGAELGLGGGIGALMVNASFSLAFAQEYRGTAECKTVIHADSRSGAVADTLMARVKDLDQQKLDLNQAPKVDAEIYESLKRLSQNLTKT